jgi:hypothetical protein
MEKNSVEIGSATGPAFVSPPSLTFPAFFECPLCGSLEGGRYGTGPLAVLSGPARDVCEHAWRPVGPGRFAALARERHGVDLHAENPRWKAVLLPGAGAA